VAYPVELQQFVDIRIVAFAAIDVVLARRQAAGRAVNDDDRALRDRFFAAQREPWSTGVLTSSSLRVSTELNPAVQYNRDGDELDATTYNFSVTDVDHPVRIHTAERSISVVRSLYVEAEEAESQTLRDALVQTVALYLNAPRFCAHPAAPEGWLTRGRSFGLATPGMNIDWRNVNAVEFSHREGAGRFVMLYARDRVACCVIGPRPALDAPRVVAELAPQRPVDIAAITAAVTRVLFGDAERVREAQGEWVRDPRGFLPTTGSLEYFESDHLASPFHWTRTRIGDGWVLTSEFANPAANHHLYECAWVDEVHRFHGHLRYIVWSGRTTLTTRFSGAHAEAADAVVRALVGAGS
jgi:hypothetical protein